MFDLDSNGFSFHALVSLESNLKIHFSPRVFNLRSQSQVLIRSDSKVRQERHHI